jgi:hypothetical protein
MMAKRKSGRGQNGFRKGRRPHNSGAGHSFENLSQLVEKLGAEEKQFTVNGETVRMTAAELSFRRTVERALGGSRRDLAHVLRLVAEYPTISGAGQLESIMVINGAIADV